jgi:1-deoxy-D-xylulose-5-phosphate reductoisomerase
MKNIAILGSTGSIGVSALDVARRFPDRLRVVALSANSNIDLLYAQAKEFRPRIISVMDKAACLRLESWLGKKSGLVTEEEGLLRLCSDKRIDMVLIAISGSGALLPLLSAIQHGKDIALANKESLVMAGDIVMEMASMRKVKIIPIDSEQSAIWQCLEHEDRPRLRTIYLTASGGPLRTMSAAALKKVSVSRVLRHPRWKMGRKITVDSATMMNKGLELLEAMSLFGVTSDRVKVVVHPEAVVHSMVEFVDGVVMAQLSVTDMRIPIQYALTYPERLENKLTRLDFRKSGALHFEKPDFKRFPCLALAYRAAEESGTMPAVMNAANEVSVEEFLKKDIGFTDIAKVIEMVMEVHRKKTRPSLDQILEADSWARREAYRMIARMN